MPTEFKDIPWTAILTVAGWVGLVAIFYGMTKTKLDEHDRMIARLNDVTVSRYESLVSTLNRIENKIDRQQQR